LISKQTRKSLKFWDRDGLFGDTLNVSTANHHSKLIARMSLDKGVVYLPNIGLRFCDVDARLRGRRFRLLAPNTPAKLENKIRFQLKLFRRELRKTKKQKTNRLLHT
jgi:hypothetical protein